jgi:UDP-N-acetylmuramyl pentapeptide phosphotransferase/UDP-N-acetylglucosamine-1-phosphate transferase
MFGFFELFRGVVIQYPIIITLFSFFVGMISMKFVLRVAIRKQMVVRPNKRTSHTGNIPNVGGINIVTSFLTSYLLFTLSPLPSQSQFLLAGLYIIFIVGFFDDLLSFSPRKKLIGELIAGFILITLADVRLTNLQGFMGISGIGYLLSYFVSFFLFLLIINSLNLIDGVDGLATGIGMIICGFLAIYFYLIASTGNPEYINLSIMGFSLIGSLAIFFIYNVFGKRTKIFMGDSGALVLGYVVYTLIINFIEINNLNIQGQPLVNEHYYMRCAPAMAVCVLAVPLLDTLRVMITRVKKGYSPFKPDKNHVHHLLLSIGLKHKYVTYILVGVNLSFIGLALIGHGWRNIVLVFVAVAMAIVYTIILWRVVDYYKKK